QVHLAAPSHRQFELLIDSPLQVVSAQWNDTKLAVNASRSEDTTSPQRVAVIELPEGTRGGGTLRIKAIAPLEPNTRSRLPLVHLSDALWEQGSARLIISAEMKLDELLVRDCRQTISEVPTDPDAGTTIDLQFFNDRAAIDVAVGRRQERIRVE